MKSMFAWGAFTKAPTALLVAVAVAFSSGPSASAVEIAYEGFGYPDGGYLAISDASTQELINDFGITDAGIYDGIDDGTAGFYDHDNDVNTPDIQDTVLGDPARAGGTGSWVANAGWIKRTITSGGSHKVNGNETLSYTDSLGNALATTMGKPQWFATGSEIWRAFDASTVDPGLTIPNTGSENTISAIDFEVPTLGKQGTVVWLSFLGDNTGGNSAAALQLWNKRDAVSLTETPKSRTAGFSIHPDKDWFNWNANNGSEASHPLGTNTSIAGSFDADNAGEAFFVAKLDYSATTAGETDGWADVTIWINPNLDTEPDVADAAALGDGYIPFNGFYLNGGSGGPTSRSIDEIRLGTTFADVAPIAAGLDGDFDVDGDVDGADFLLWQQGGSPNGATAGDLALWQGSYGAGNVSAAISGVPEPTSVLLLGIAGTLWVMRRR